MIYSKTTLCFIKQWIFLQKNVLLIKLQKNSKDFRFRLRKLKSKQYNYII